jgi:hypothetical protein
MKLFVEIFEVYCFDSDVHNEGQVFIEQVLFLHVRVLCVLCVRHLVKSAFTRRCDHM